MRGTNTTRPVALDLAGHLGRRAVIAALVAVVMVGGVCGRAGANEDDQSIYPRFLSLKANPVNLRKGPGLQYPKSWVYRRAGLPVEVLRSYRRWRQVRDFDGAKGWILHTLISQRRTALVMPWAHADRREKADNRLISLRKRANVRGRTVAMLEPGTLVGLKSCNRRWCLVSVSTFRGYIEQNKLWGVYPEEVVR